MIEFELLIPSINSTNVTYSLSSQVCTPEPK